MKKTSKMFGAVALSAALAMGMAMPAFATDAKPTSNGIEDATNGIADKNAGAEGQSDDGEATGQTTVLLNATNTQINATIPVTIAVYAKTAGGELLTPREYAYTLTNNSTSGNLYVTQIDSTLLGDATNVNEEDETADIPWTAAAATDLNGASTTTIADAIKNKVGDMTYTARYGSVYVQMVTGLLTDTYHMPEGTTDSDLIALDGHKFKENKKYIDAAKNQTFKLVQNKVRTATFPDLGIEVGKDGTGDNVLGLRLEGYNSKLKNTTEITDQLTQLMKITYTVQASSKYVANYDLYKTTATSLDYKDVTNPTA